MYNYPNLTVSSNYIYYEARAYTTSFYSDYAPRVEYLELNAELKRILKRGNLSASIRQLIEEIRKAKVRKHFWGEPTIERRSHCTALASKENHRRVQAHTKGRSRGPKRGRLVVRYFERKHRSNTGRPGASPKVR